MHFAMRAVFRYLLFLVSICTTSLNAITKKILIPQNTPGIVVYLAEPALTLNYIRFRIQLCLLQLEQHAGSFQTFPARILEKSSREAGAYEMAFVN